MRTWKKCLLALGLAAAVPFLATPRGVQATVSGTTVRTVSALGDNATVNFTIGFSFQDNTQILVYRQEESATPYVQTAISQGAGASKFTITGGNPGTTVHMGTAPSTTQRLVIIRSLPMTQTVNYDDADAFPADSHEQQMDKQIMLIQQLNQALGLKVGLSSTSTSSVPTLPNALADRFVLWNHAATDFTLAPTSAETFSNGYILMFNGSTWSPYDQLTKNTSYDGHLINTSNPHNVTAAQVGNGTAQWNANKLQGYAVDSAAPISSYLLGWDGTKWTSVAPGTPTTGSVTNSLLATMPPNTVKANVTGGAASPTDVGASSANVASNFVVRDASGNFSAGSITAALVGAVTGNASTATALATTPSACTNQFARGIAVSGNASCASVANTDLSTMAANTVKANVTGGSATPTDVGASTANVASAFVIRDSNGKVATGAQTVTGNADEVQSTIKANSSQTANIANWTNSSGTALASVLAAGQFQGPNGSVTTPSFFTPTGGGNTGFYFNGALGGTFGYNGTNVWNCIATQCQYQVVLNQVATGSVTTPTIVFGSNLNTGFYQIGANNWGFTVSNTKLWDWSSALAALTGRETITGSADAVQLTVKGNATQTSHLQDWTNSGNSVVASVNNTGDLVANSATLSTPLSKSGGGTGQDNSSLTFPASGTLQATTPNNHGVLVSGSGATASVVAPDASTSKLFTSGGSSADPSWALAGNSSLATMATQTFKGRTTAGTGSPEDLTATQATAILNTMVGDSGSGGTKGLVPAPASGDAAASKFLKADGTWSQAGTGSGTGAINYITNSGAETDTSGWATYSDGAQNTPVDGTGGTATNLTFSRSTSSPLISTGSFSMVQANSTSLQGKGVSYDFTADSAVQGHVGSVSFYYNASSTFVASDGITAPLNDGTASTNAGNSDVEVFMYDVTNAVLLPVSPQIMAAKGSNNFLYTGKFQFSSNSTSYRLILHVATASANATGWTFKFDNVFVGPQTTVYGAPVTDWVAYTPTFTGFGTVSTQEFYSRRNGSNIEIQGYFVAGTTTATEARISLPSGLTSADATYITNRREVGRMNVGASNGSATVLIETSKTYFTMGADNSSTDGTAKANGNSLATSGNSISLFVSGIPIQGWSSTTTMSQETDTRVVAASVALAADYAVSANAVVKFDTSLFDTHGAYSTSTGLYTAPVSGYYQVSATMSTTSTAAGFYVAVNGTGKVYLTTPANSPYGGSQLVKVNAGDTIGVYSDSTKTVDGTSTPYFSVMSISRVSGPATIAATDAVSMRYYSSSSSLSGSLGTITYATKDWDTHSGYASGVYTVPVPGKYQVNAMIKPTGTFTLNNTVILELQKNSTVVTRDTVYAAAAVTDLNASVNDLVNCVAGDTLRIQASTGATGPSIASSNFENFLSIIRVGN